jgi:hypothetical protein
MGEHWIDDKDRGVGRCTYCLRVGLAKNLRKMPVKYRDDEYDLGCEYCPKCYPDVLKAVKNQPWNRDK